MCCHGEGRHSHAQHLRGRCGKHNCNEADIAPPRPQSPRDPKQGNQRCHHQDGVDDRSVEDLAQQAPDGSIAGKIGRDPGHIPGNGQAERGLQGPRKRPPLRRNGRQEPAAGNDLRIERGHDLVMRDWGVARHVSCSERDDESRHDQHDEIERCPGCQVFAHRPQAPGRRQAANARSSAQIGMSTSTSCVCISMRVMG